MLKISFCFFVLGAILAECCTVTTEAEEGPYYKDGAPDSNGTVCEWENYENASQLLVHGRIFDSECKETLEAELDIWSADPNGDYSPKEGIDYTCRGRVKTDPDGYYEYLTVVPGRYRMGDSMRPAHIHYKIRKTGGDSSKIFTTQQYFENDPYFESDPCAACHAGDSTLTVPLEPSLEPSDQSFMIRFDIVLP